MLPSLREWQVESIKCWTDAKFHGCFEVATGGGKTTFALACFDALRQEKPNLKCLVVVPTTALLDQWLVSFEQDLGIPESDIKILKSNDLIPNKLVNICVINTARNFKGTTETADELLLIVDECHRAGSPLNALALVVGCFATIGLSATPYRDFDEGFETLVSPVLGPILYRYPLESAIRDGVLADLEMTYVKIPLLPSEQKEYDELTKRIGRAFAADPTEESAKSLLRKRARMYNNAFYRVPVLCSILGRNRGKRTIVFVESIETAHQAKVELDRRNHSVTIYHSKMGPHLRRANLAGFRRGIFDVLIACRALDEGLNVPEAQLAVIVAGTSSKRQRIQRVGRVLRVLGDKASGGVYTLFATAVEESRLTEESEFLSQFVSCEWQEASHE
jgi:superfamily II DNA or RNA helicase